MRDVSDLLKAEFRGDAGAYTGVSGVTELAEELRVPVSRIAKLDANENHYGPIAPVLSALSSSVNDASPFVGWSSSTYPDANATALRRSIARYMGHGVGENQIVVGAGSDEILDILMRCVDGDSVVIAPPTFGMYNHLARICGLKTVAVPRIGQNFSLDIDGLVAAVKSSAARLLILASPNNPTGGLLMPTELQRLLELDCIIVVDEAYAEFSGASAINFLSEYPNLVVTRTLSKWASLAGLRVGFAVAQEGLALRLAALRQPYGVNGLAAVATLSTLEHVEEVQQCAVRPLMVQMQRLLQIVDRLAWLEPVLPTYANFVLVKVQPPFTADAVVAALRRLGVVVRVYSSNPMLQGYFRISSGREQDIDRLEAALSQLDDLLGGFSNWPFAMHSLLDLVAPAAYLWDMDGVIADVATSYRRAIVETGAHFGVTISSGDIEDLKNKGGANNDWVLTHRIVISKLSHGHSDEVISKPSLADVTEVFEKLYQGSHNAQGLCESETLIPVVETMQKMFDSVQGAFALVTGRPRSDAMKFLTKHGLTHLFPVVVCMEDAVPKPSPAPVRLAMQRLRHMGLLAGGASASRCIMIGDTVDDVAAAVAAGAKGVGVLTPSLAALNRQDQRFKTAVEAMSVAQAVAIVEPGCKQLLCTTMPVDCGQQEVTGRFASLARKTGETDVRCTVSLDGQGRSTVNTGVGFLDHMLSALSKHSQMDLALECAGDLHVCDHHSVEDVALTLGSCVREAIGSVAGLTRFGHALCPLDEALARAVVDVSGRPWAEVNLKLERDKIGTLSCEMIPHFFQSFAATAKMTVHVEVLHGANDHHRAEAAFKAFARALRVALSKSSDTGVPSTKGVL